MLFMDVFAQGGRVASDGGGRQTRTDARRDPVVRRGNNAMRDAFDRMRDADRD